MCGGIGFEQTLIIHLFFHNMGAEKRWVGCSVTFTGCQEAVQQGQPFHTAHSGFVHCQPEEVPLYNSPNRYWFLFRALCRGAFHLPPLVCRMYREIALGRHRTGIWLGTSLILGVLWRSILLPFYA